LKIPQKGTTTGHKIPRGQKAPPGASGGDRSRQGLPAATPLEGNEKKGVNRHLLCRGEVRGIPKAEGKLEGQGAGTLTKKRIRGKTTARWGLGRKIQTGKIAADQKALGGTKGNLTSEGSGLEHG